MSEQGITVNKHSVGVLTPHGWAEVVNHDGACTPENCGRHLAEIEGRDRSRWIINQVIDAVEREGQR